MIIAKQSTAITVTVGPVLDADGVAVTDGVVGDFKISKNGGAPAALNGSATLTHRNTGHYSLALTASDVDTVGTAEIVIDDTTNACAPKELQVVEEAVYDAFYAASAAGIPGIPANWITAAGIAADAITAAKVAADVIAAIQSGLATSAEITSVLNAITGLNNLSALANLYGSPLLEIPDAGDPDAVYAFTLVVRDNEGKLVALDAAPTITAANAAGTDRSANLSVVSNPATGRYTFTYSVGDTDTPESLRITCSGTVSAEGRYIEWVGAVVDYDTLTTLLAVKAKTDLIPASPASAGDVTSAETAILTRLGTPAGADIATDIAAVKTDTGNLVSRITSTLFSGITKLSGWLRLLARSDAAATTDEATSLSEINANGGSGAGSYTPSTDSLEAPVNVALGPDDIQDIVDGVVAAVAFPTAEEIAAELAGNNVVASFPALIEGEETTIVQGSDYYDADGKAATITINKTGIESAVADDWEFKFWGQGDSTSQVVTGSPSSSAANTITVKFDLPAAKTGAVNAGLGGWRVIHKPDATTREFPEVEGLLRVKPEKAAAV